MMMTTTLTRSNPVTGSVADDPRWARIVARDTSADGQLWYSVSTTGVYCRPTCPSRLAKPTNVQLHDSLESTRATGLRPCKRCHPDQPSKGVVGTKEEIRFTVRQTSLGAIVVASSAKGIASVLLGDETETLVRDLQDRFPNASLIGADGADEMLVARVVGLVETPRIAHGLPLDVRGTTFQTRVWQALQQIPAGKKVTYAAVARRIGLPKAVRAVARACAANKLAIAIPCHRVVRSDGSLSGYAWGVERKRVLIDREALPCR